jgi:uncharacterized protein YggE
LPAIDAALWRCEHRVRLLLHFWSDASAARSRRDGGSGIIGEMSSPEASSDRIVVVGRAKRGVEADVANLVLTVVEVDADQRAAFARCRERVNALLPRLRESAGEEATVTTGHLELDRHYSDVDSGEIPREYEASCALVVECAPEVAGAVIAEAVEVGTERLGGPRYGVRDPSTTIDELLAEAFREAQRKARRLADAADRELGVALAIEEGHVRRDYAAAAFAESGAAMSGSSASSSLDLQPAGIELRTTVRVTFALLPS